LKLSGAPQPSPGGWGPPPGKPVKLTRNYAVVCSAERGRRIKRDSKGARQLSGLQPGIGQRLPGAPGKGKKC